ncbi:hypothetical protein NDU88_003177 [Pleurodeles waltl]|uniref:Uncharacterized protein n=1 Tax=Pleurodeles waltl TaxID=8319 RepID=A0AAV7SFX5_PLEWA|nr:hypothetical protein NDU88_003177 [Pleurodeles waltl]
MSTLVREPGPGIEALVLVKVKRTSQRAVCGTTDSSTPSGGRRRLDAADYESVVKLRAWPFMQRVARRATMATETGLMKGDELKAGNCSDHKRGDRLGKTTEKSTIL